MTTVMYHIKPAVNPAVHTESERSVPDTNTLRSSADTNMKLQQSDTNSVCFFQSYTNWEQHPSDIWTSGWNFGDEWSDFFTDSWKHWNIFGFMFREIPKMHKLKKDNTEFSEKQIVI